jgi:L-ribulose-5-phosphate 3-epimerase
MKQIPYSYLNHFKDKLIALHLLENGGDGDAHWLPFAGTVDWNYLMKLISKKTSYNGPVSLESSVNEEQ